MKLKVEGKTEYERFDNAMKKILSVSKEEMDRRLAKDREIGSNRKWIAVKHQ